MGWFRKREREAKPLAQHQERTANKIAERILAMQRSTAAKLNAKAQKMGIVKTRIILGALLLGFAVYLVCIIINALF
jgi:DNA-binding transcriptional regulator LsrR (DeoR family)